MLRGKSIQLRPVGQPELAELYTRHIDIATRRSLIASRRMRTAPAPGMPTVCCPYRRRFEQGAGQVFPTG